jgi:hypothetical protein
MMAFAVRDLGQNGYHIGFVVFVFLALFSLTMAWILKYTSEESITVSSQPGGQPGADTPSGGSPLSEGRRT